MFPTSSRNADSQSVLDSASDILLFSNDQAGQT